MVLARAHRWMFAALAACALLSARDAAADGSIVVWPTLTPAGDDGAVRKPRESDAKVFVRSQELDLTLRDAVQDLGYTLDVADAGPTSGHARDLDLVERASNGETRDPTKENPGTWVVSARIEARGGDRYIVRIVAVPPKGKQLRVRVEEVAGADVPARGLTMLRELLSAGTAQIAEAEARESTRIDRTASSGAMAAPRSPGRAVLAANGALFGGFAAYSIQRANGSDDPRLLYPLLALGTGIGIGTSLLAAEEWDVSTGDAWVIAAGSTWDAASALSLANGYNTQPLTDRYAWALGGGVVGIGFSTFLLTRSKMDEGDATLVHSGAALGTFAGSLADLIVRGSTTASPSRGAGFGSAIGLVSAGLLATTVRVSPSRVLLVDLGAGLGALAGASLASPLVFEDVTVSKTRGFLAATAAGTLLGGGLAWFFTRDAKANTDTNSARFAPTAGVIGQSATPSGAVPAYGVGLGGTF